MRARARLALCACLLGLVASPAEAREPRTVKLRFPRLRVAGGTNPEACVAVRVPTSVPFDLASFEIRHRRGARGIGVQHFLVYLYTGEHLAAFPKGRSAPIQSRGCLDLGPSDRDRRQLIASGTGRRSRGDFASGVALRLEPVPDAPGGPPTGLGFVLDGEWINGTRASTVSAVVVLRRARAKDTRIASLFTDDSAERALVVSPGTLASTETLAAGQTAGRGPGTDACVLMVTGQMHKRGRFFGVDLLGPGGELRNPEDGPENPFEPGRRHLFGAVDWTDMGSLRPPTPIPLGAGERLHYACWADNGLARSVRLGCAETDGVPPGTIGTPARSCAADTDCPGFPGGCEPANLVAGPTPDDEVCRLHGIYLPADPSTGCAALTRAVEAGGTRAACRRDCGS